ncbi:hypothetical protein F5887DRAFT_1072592 [Amanita rubescens]|nr:hypothetical protein F5887DRAFT_1072592 [Amanita rubescens]
MDNPRQLNLNCVIEGEYSVFPVTVGHDCVTGTLRQKIKQACAVTFKDVDAYTLPNCGSDIGLLPQVNVNLNDYDEPSLSNLRLGDLEGIKKLTWESVSELWPNQPSTAFLHIIVKAPTTAAIPLSTSQNSNLPHGSSDDDNVLASLHELHTHLWGKDRIDHRDELACSILDLAPFDALQSNHTSRQNPPHP